LAADEEATLFHEGREKSLPDQQKWKTLLLFHCQQKRRSSHCLEASSKALEFKNQLMPIPCQGVKQLL